MRRSCACIGRGNHLTLIAAANCYQRPIRVWSTAPGDDWWLQIEPKHYKVSALLVMRPRTCFTEPDDVWDGSLWHGPPLG